jgi:hypothetical protein
MTAHFAVTSGLRWMLALYALLSVLVTALGCWGLLLSAKHYERNIASWTNHSAQPPARNVGATGADEERGFNHSDCCTSGRLRPCKAMVHPLPLRLTKAYEEKLATESVGYDHRLA